MHTTRVGVDGNSFYANHNGDWSGDVQIYRALTHQERERAAAINAKTEDVKIADLPFAVLEELVGQKILVESISAMEQMNGRTLIERLCER